MEAPYIGPTCWVELDITCGCAPDRNAGCGMGIKEIKTLADALAKNKGLTYLSLGMVLWLLHVLSTRVQASSCRAPALYHRGIMPCGTDSQGTYVRIIAADNNTGIGPDGVQCLMTMLKKNDTIEHLSFNGKYSLLCYICQHSPICT